MLIFLHRTVWSKHSHASVVLQHSKSPHKDSREPSPRLKKRDLAAVTLKEPETKILKAKIGELKDSFAKEGFLLFKVLCNQVAMMNGSKFADFEFIKEIITKPMPKVWRVQQKKNARNQSSYTKQDKSHQQTIDKQNFIWTINDPPCNVRHSSQFLSGWAGSCSLYMQSAIVQSYHCHNVRWSSSIQIFLSSYLGNTLAY